MVIMLIKRHNWIKVEITGTSVNALIKFHISYKTVDNEIGGNKFN